MRVQQLAILPLLSALPGYLPRRSRGRPVKWPRIYRYWRELRRSRSSSKAPGHRRRLRIDDFRQRQPADGAAASVPTTAYLAYGETAMYVVFVCKEDPAKVRAHLSRRESVSGDDLVGIAIDTFHYRRRAYMFYANPLGVQLDGISTEGQADDYKFDTVWSADGRLTRDGYIVRFVIPFKSMRARMGPARTWGIALTRRVPRNDEYDTWPRITDRSRLMCRNLQQ